MDLMVEAPLVGGLLPFLVALAVIGLALRRTKGERTHKLVQAASAAALGLGFCAGYALSSWTVFKPEESWHWLPYLVLGAMILGMLSWLPWAVRLAGALGLAYVAVRLLMPDFESLEPERLTWQCVLGGGILATWLLADGAMRLRPDERWGLCWLLTLVAMAAQMKFLGIMMFVQLTGLSLAPVAVFFLLEWKRSWRGLLTAAAPVLALALPALLFLGKVNTFSEVPLASYGWLLAAPLAFCLMVLLPDSLGRKRTVLAFTGLLGCLGWGLYLAWAATGTPQI